MPPRRYFRFGRDEIWSVGSNLIHLQTTYDTISKRNCPCDSPEIFKMVLTPIWYSMPHVMKWLFLDHSYESLDESLLCLELCNMTLDSIRRSIVHHMEDLYKPRKRILQDAMKAHTISIQNTAVVGVGGRRGNTNVKQRDMIGIL